MRLFQSHVCIDDFGPPPPFLRDPTRDNMNHMTQFRDGKHRVATPEKVAIMSLSTSFEKRRLGKHQQILSEMSQRCREQEVAELSTKLGAKCNLGENDRSKTREVTFYTTTFMNKKFNGIHDDAEEQSSRQSNSTNPKPLFEKTYKHFPARKIIKHQTKFDMHRSSNRVSPLKTPKIDPSPVRALVTQAASDPFPVKSKHASSNKMNGLMHTDFFLTRRDKAATLILPSIDMSPQDPIEAFSTSRVQMGTRSKVDSSIAGSNFSNRSSKHGIKNGKVLKIQNEEITLSDFQNTTDGRSPPPNSAEPPHKITAR